MCGIKILTKQYQNSWHHLLQALWLPRCALLCALLVIQMQVFAFLFNPCIDIPLQVAADTFLYTPLNVGLFFALMTVVEGGHWKVLLGSLLVS